MGDLGVFSKVTAGCSLSQVWVGFPHPAGARGDPSGSLGLRPGEPTPWREPQKRVHDPYLVKVQAI